VVEPGEWTRRAVRRRRGLNSSYSSRDGALPILWDAPEFSYTDQNGGRVSNKDLRGHIWISDFFFTSCTSICPMMTAQLAHLQKIIPDPDVRFISFSVDPDHDTPGVLKQYAAMWKADATRWRFLSTDRRHLVATAEGMRTFVQPPTKDSPIQHSSLFILTDRDDHVRGVYDSNDSAALHRLVHDVARLAGHPGASPVVDEPETELRNTIDAPADPGAALYAARGCRGCHTQGGVAPPLENCFGRKVLLQDGRTVISDEAYLRESILDPARKVVSGYPALMPSYRGQLTNTELDELVGYLKALRTANGSSSAVIRRLQVTDPVCKMQIDPKAAAFRTTFSGKTYYFCSILCRDRFLKAPSRFAR